MQNITGGNALIVDDPAYRHLISGAAVGSVRLQTPAPAQAQVEPQFEVLVASDETARYAFRVETSQERVAPRDIRLMDAHPTLTEGLDRSITAWVRNVIDEALADLFVLAEEARKHAGL
jgi:phosphopantetheine adenylyltransferase